MTVVAMTLTDFLLSRIAEDEAWARRRAEQQARSLENFIAVCRSKGVDFSGGPSEAGDGSRVLAECEAKRRIIAVAEYVTEVEGGGADIVMHDGYGPDLPAVLKSLALPYADHPDYREEWRP